ncbi:MAG: hemolysin [Bacteroidetes bacterium HGW-Bacteroidetes-21]|jgi:putative hemolysin|nr:MAG: hemolysin [Bacteroidetes bacterium HGW-Bacteroidetes-21]
MTLITPGELKKAIFRSFGKGNFTRALVQLVQTKKINKFYSSHSNDSPKVFTEAVIKRLKLKYEVTADELKRIPKENPLVIIANHPFGGIDGILLIKIISEIRPDIKVLANPIFQRISPLKDFILPINPFVIKKDKTQILSGFKLAFTHVQNGGTLVIFPAGEVATFNPETKTFSEGIWQYSILRFIKKLKSPVLPIYFQSNSHNPFIIFNLANIKDKEIPSELFNLKKRNIRIRIGNPIPLKEQEHFTDISQYGRFLRVKTNSLGNPIEVRKFFKPQFQFSSTVEPIVEPVSNELIQKDIDNLPEKFYLFKTNNFKVFCAPSLYVPNILNEIGRLREITFRAVGEGTNKSIDLDEFDLYYNHLFIWDTDLNKIVGAYRVGKGKDIVSQFGKKGFYIHSLFRINDRFTPYLQQSLELGRSFIVKEYQQKPMPLFMLWKGILYFLLKHPEYRYLIGPVSISNQFSQMSKALITDFIKTNYFDNELSSLIKPRTQFKVILHDIDTEIINEATQKDINKLDKFIEDIEPANFRLPVLLKKYIKLNAKIIGFNIDPKFNDALDGLMLLDLFKVPMETIKSLSKELEDTNILERFYNGDQEIMNRFNE